MVVLSLDNILSKILVLVVAALAIYSLFKSLSSNDIQEHRHYELLLWITIVLLSVLTISARLP